MKEGKGKNIIIILLLVIVVLLVSFIILLATKTITLDNIINTNSNEDISGNSSHSTNNESNHGSEDNTNTKEELFEIKFNEEEYSATTEGGTEVRSLRNIPIITSSERNSSAQKITNYLKEKSDEHWNEAKNMTDQVVEGNVNYNDMGITLLYKKTIADNNRISFALEQEGWFGGVGWGFEQGFNFDTNTGELLTLKNIGKDTYKIVKEECEKYIEDHKDSDSINIYKNSTGQSLDELLSTDGNWYFEYNQLTIVFPKYSLGIQSIKIPISKSKINDSLYDKYKF